MGRNTLDFNIRDAYPNMGTIDTRTTVQPEAYDQVAIDEAENETRERVESETNNGVSKKSIYKVLFGGLIAVIVLTILS